MDIRIHLQHLKKEAKLNKLIEKDVPLTELVKYSRELDKYIMIEMKNINKQ